jgi:hypothetical protein
MNVRFFSSFAILLVSVVSAQAPIAEELLDGKSVYLRASGVERRWLDHVADEFRRQDRFALVARPGEADLVVTLAGGDTGDSVIVPIGGFFFDVAVNAFTLVVQEAIGGEVLWEDSRSIGWARRGTALDLVKDLHKAIGSAESRNDR